MEILLNCVWLVLGLSLIAAWSVHAWSTRACEPDELLPSRCLQFTALLMLVVLLFPVISLTDDIAMSTAPREAERALRLHDTVDGSQNACALLPAAVAWTELVTLLWRSGPTRPLEPVTPRIIQLAGSQLTVDSRPPPMAL